MLFTKKKDDALIKRASSHPYGYADTHEHIGDSETTEEFVEQNSLLDEPMDNPSESQAHQINRRHPRKGAQNTSNPDSPQIVHIPIDVRVILCLPTDIACHPEWIGLEGENLESVQWLYVCCDADEARKIAKSEWLGEFWVVGSDSVDGINLAAALKRDRYNSPVKLINFEASGSLCSRASSAGIDEVLDKPDFLEAYADQKSFSQAFCRIGQDDDPTESFPGVRENLETTNIEPDQQGRSFSDQQPLCPSQQAKHSSQQSACSTKTDSFERTSRSQGSNSSTARFNNPTFNYKKMQKRGSLVCVVGAGGGVGKSTISALLGYVMQVSGKRVAILDADFQFGDLHYLLGEERPIRADELINMPERIEGLDTHLETPLLIASPIHVEHSEVASNGLKDLVDALCARFDTVVVNTGAMWTDTQIQLLGEAAASLFIIDQRPSSIRTCRRALDLCSRCGVASQSFLFVANRCSRNSLFSSIDISCAMNGAHAVELREGGKEVEELLGLGRPMDLIESKNPLVTSLFEVAQTEFPPTLQIEASRKNKEPKHRSEQARRSKGERRRLKKRRSREGRR